VFCKVFWHQTPLVFCSKAPIAVGGQFTPCSSDNHFPIGALPQNTIGVFPGVWHQNTLQNTQGILQGILVLSTSGIWRSRGPDDKDYNHNTNTEGK
jgi:hypothetical protein